MKEILWAGQSTDYVSKYYESGKTWQEVYFKLNDNNVVSLDDEINYFENQNIDWTDLEKAIDSLKEEDWQEILLNANGNAYYQQYKIIDTNNIYVYKGDVFKGWQLAHEAWRWRGSDIEAITEAATLINSLYDVIYDVVDDTVISESIIDEIENLSGSESDVISRTLLFITDVLNRSDDTVNDVLDGVTHTNGGLRLEDFYIDVERWNEYDD